MGFTHTDASSSQGPTYDRKDVCAIWYPGGDLILIAPDTCDDNEPYIVSISCLTTCPAGCLSCDTSTTCSKCSVGRYARKDGRCVSATNCGRGFFANEATGRCEGRSLSLSLASSVDGFTQPCRIALPTFLLHSLPHSVRCSMHHVFCWLFCG